MPVTPSVVVAVQLQPPLVVIPGAFGSSLRDRRTGREIWPGTNPQLLVSNYRALELDIIKGHIDEIRAAGLYKAERIITSPQSAHRAAAPAAFSTCQTIPGSGRHCQNSSASARLDSST